MLPYLKTRIISTVRCPGGVNGECFYKKHIGEHNQGIKSVHIPNDNDNKEDYYYIKDRNGLISEVQMNSFEFHIWGSKVKSLEKPDIMVFDFDPDKKVTLTQIRSGVKDLKKILDDLKVKSYLKTSGGKGYHVVAKIKSKNWEEHGKIAKDIATLMAQKWPNKYTTNIRKNAREGKIFIDWVRNTRMATNVAPYSLRIKKGAAISMPIKWSELDKVKPDEIKIPDAIKRLKRKDPWEGFLET